MAQNDRLTEALELFDQLTPEEQKIYDYDWVEPGVTIWSWLMYPDSQSDMELHSLPYSGSQAHRHTEHIDLRTSGRHVQSAEQRQIKRHENNRRRLELQCS